MPFEVTRMGLDPIVLVRVHGKYVVNDTIQLRGRLEDICLGINGPIYRIIDTTDASIHLTEAMHGLRYELDGLPYTVSDSRIHTLLIIGGNATALYTVIESIRLTMPSLKFPFFASMAKAIRFALDDIKERRAGNPEVIPPG
jgi:hypothetical protein